MCETPKERTLRHIIIILTIIVLILAAIIVWLGWSLYVGFTVQYAPVEGAWYCKELGLTLSYDGDIESYLVKDGKEILCIKAGHKQSKHVRIYEANIVAYEGDEPVYCHKDLLFSFEYLQLEQNCFVVCDSLGYNHTFIRIS